MLWDFNEILLPLCPLSEVLLYASLNFSWKAFMMVKSVTVKFFLFFQISVEELGYGDMILYPRSIQINFCAGTCVHPLVGNSNATKHAYIQSIAAKLQPELVPPPCCVPHQLRPFNFLYRSERMDLALYHIVDMIAVSCGCK